jgi:hypothetical protein
MMPNSTRVSISKLNTPEAGSVRDNLLNCDHRNLLL